MWFEKEKVASTKQSSGSLLRKKILAVIAAIASGWALAYPGIAWTDPETGIEWFYTLSGDEASVGGSLVDYWSDDTAVPWWTTGAITIPSVMDGYPVTGVGFRAFCGCSDLTDVTIPPSVTSISWQAFYGCSGIMNMTIPSSVTSIGHSAFSDCSALTQFVVDADNPNYRSVNGLLLSKDGKTLVAGINGDVTIPEGVTSIEQCAFKGLSGLTRIVMPSSVTSIGDMAFQGCDGLGDGVVIIDDCVLCVNGMCPTNVVLPSTARLIAGNAFAWCYDLKSVTIPSTVRSIGDSAFYYCSGLGDVTMSEGWQASTMMRLHGVPNLKA